MVKTKKMLAFAGVLVLLFGTVGTLWALNADYNRPTPLMDYVPQELGIYDTMYPVLDEDSCRSCHGSSLADRHHNTETVIRDRLCIPCHDIIPDPPGVLVFRNCVVDEGAYGCHSWDNAKLGTNGWHHQTDWSGSENCTVCHDPNLVAQISAFRSFADYPPSVVTPTPFSCENCHWEQGVAGWLADANDPFDDTTLGHPSDYNHYNVWGQSIGYFEYGKEIKGNYDTHHMGFQGNVSNQCAKCHSLDPGNPSWDPYNDELIRYCQVCHDVGTLHTIQPHVADVDGWDAVGFHAGGGGTEPTVYRTFEANEQCFGCHADLIPDPPAVEICTGYIPAINITADGISPNSGACYTYVTLRGVNFGVEQYEDSFVQMRLNGIGNPWETVPAYSWTETQIEFEIPCWKFVKGNYKVRVQTNCGNSNKVGFALKDWGTLLSVTPDQGPCSTWLTLTGSGFTASQKTAPDGDGDGIVRFVKLVASQGDYLIKNYKNWTDTQLEAKFYNLSQDDDGDFLEDAVIKKCAGSVGTWLGSYEVYFVTLYYNDVDASTDYTAGDTVYQVTISDPEQFELTATPVIFRLNPDTIDNTNRLKIAGQNFGPYQTDGEIRVGTKATAKNPALGQGKLLYKNVYWSNTILKVKFKVPTKWQGKNRYIWVEKDGVKSTFPSGSLDTRQLKKIVINP